MVPSPVPTMPDATTKGQALASMTQQADGLRAEVVRLSRALDIAQLDVGNLRAAQLLEANERLVLAALQAEDIAETAVNNLSMVAQLNQSDTPFHARRI